MPYKAKITIGAYNPGDIVPAEIAETWAKMYLESPTVFIPDAEEKKAVTNPELDLNKDGKVNAKDGAMASKILNDFKKKGGKK